MHIIILCLLSDHMYAPRPHPLLDGKHVVYYDNDNKTDLFVKLDYYRQNIKRARVVAVNGYLHAMKYHRAACLLDYVMRTVHIKLDQRAAVSALSSSLSVTDTSPPVLAYTETGFDMHVIARKFGEAYKKAGKTNKKKRLVQ
jgi:hypothetical protein